MSDRTVRGRFVWHELLTTDVKSAARFFAKVVGWKAESWPNDDAYTLFLGGGRQMAGLMALPDDARKMGQPPHWMCYIGTPNVDETATLASTLGGRILRAPADIPTVGRFAIVQDPQGAVFGIYAPNRMPGPETDPALMDFSWHELATTDWRGALTFYGKLFGWQATTSMEMDGGLGTYQMYGHDGRTLGGMYSKPTQMPGPSAWLAYIRVPDSRKTVDVVRTLGGRVVNGPMEVPGGDWIAQGMDLEGAMFAVHSKAAAAPIKARASAGPAKAQARRRPAQQAARKSAAVRKKKAPAKRKAAPKKHARSARRTTSARKGRRQKAGRRR